ncbi:predicted protein [Sclerotinia sclerotiorum 1980 UF-70]|uniref:Uncharacterized protein n=1 Tax=Sclerotinia sclerotiorum (strain ATCC 18683 / 1980 / Ss-1) TaxID=665079 RepID=A7F465_SCLS1|nr:predicted protein [Sclerotinia sclerotiorum 1980 UF-70]EDN97536.1 predicted protein [Sclerotinia sclerotiorum 1980 UF-70]
MASMYVDIDDQHHIKMIMSVPWTFIKSTYQSAWIKSLLMSLSLLCMYIIISKKLRAVTKVTLFRFIGMASNYLVPSTNHKVKG